MRTNVVSSRMQNFPDLFLQQIRWLFLTNQFNMPSLGGLYLYVVNAGPHNVSGCCTVADSVQALVTNDGRVQHYCSTLVSSVCLVGVVRSGPRRVYLLVWHLVESWAATAVHQRRVRPAVTPICILTLWCSLLSYGMGTAIKQWWD